jgi:hypothetical protein
VDSRPSARCDNRAGRGEGPEERKPHRLACQGGTVAQIAFRLTTPASIGVQVPHPFEDEP